jgi:hypothetical protein
MKTITPTLRSLEPRVTPTTITVRNTNDAGPGSLRAALLTADTLPGKDTINFHFTNPPPANSEQIITLTSGTLTSKGNVTITGPGSGKLIISGAGAFRVFDINDTAPGTDSPATISGLSIVGGSTAGNGGGVYSSESLTLKSVVVSGNTANVSGGGVFVQGGGTNSSATATISNSVISRNLVNFGDGGGACLIGLKTITIRKSIVSGNLGSESFGGGVYAQINGSGTGISIMDCSVIGNSASAGGGLGLYNSGLLPDVKSTISGSTISGNTSTATIPGGGGGGGLFSKGNIALTSSTISNNSAGRDGGGASILSFSSLTVSKCNVTGNRTTTYATVYEGGGGMFIISGGKATITSSTISNNVSASSGGGIVATDGVSLDVSSSKFASNHADVDGGGLCAAGLGSSSVDLNVNGSSFFNDSAVGDGGGIDTFGGGTISIVSSKVTGNTAGSAGGGIYAHSTVATNGVILRNDTITGNDAELGGGVWVGVSPDFHVTGGSISKNTAVEGGGFYSYSSSGSILGVTISGNSAGAGGGVASADSNVSLQVSKVVGNTAANGPNIFGTFTFV